MPEANLDPTGDGATIEWQAYMPPNWQCLLDPARQPDVPDTSSYIADNYPHNSVDEYHMDTIADVDELTSVTVWIYCHGTEPGADQNITAQLYLAATWLAPQDLNPPEGGGWCSATFNGSWTQADLDALQVRLTAVDPYQTAGLEISALYCHVTYTHEEAPPPPPPKERPELRPPAMRSPPKILMSPLIRRISGIFRSSQGRFRFNTRKGRRIHLSKRKPPTVVAQYSAMHTYAAYCWHLTDLAWRTLDKRRKIEWGKCTYRTANKARSNIDEFRRHNIPRAALGWPLLATPPDRFKSKLAHWPTHKSLRAICDNANIIVPIEGETKDGAPFGPDEGDIPIPPLDIPPCCPRKCMDHFNHCYQGAVLDRFPIVSNVPGRGRLRWECDKWYMPYGHDPDTCEPYFKWMHEWPWTHYGLIVRHYPDEDPPRTTRIGADDLICRVAYFYSYKLPQGPAWCLRLHRAEDPLAFHGTAYYYKENLDGCPHGEYTFLAQERHKYPWPRHLTLAPYKDTIEPCLECPKPPEICGPHIYLLCYFPQRGRSGKPMYTGPRFSWTKTGYNFYGLWRGTDVGYVSPIRCEPYGTWPGHWFFYVEQSPGIHAYYIKPARCQVQIPSGAFYLAHPELHPDMPYHLIVNKCSEESASWAYPDPPQSYMEWVYLLLALIAGSITVAQYNHMARSMPYGADFSIAPSIRRAVRTVLEFIGAKAPTIPCQPHIIHISSHDAERLHDILSQAIKDGKFPGLGGF